MPIRNVPEGAETPVHQASNEKPGTNTLLKALAATPALATPALAESLSMVASRSGLPLHTQYVAPFRFNSLALAVAPCPPQVVFCNKPIPGLDDLAGRKIRASGRMTARFPEASGAGGINVTF